MSPARRLAASPGCRRCAGRAWTGRQALQLGLVDGLGDMRGVMQERFGERARFLLCRCGAGRGGDVGLW